MKSYDIVGYAYNADTYCVNCAEDIDELDSEGNEKHPMFAGDESDHEQYCCICHEIIESSVLEPNTLELIEDQKYPQINFADIENLRIALIESVQKTITEERENLSDYRNSDIDGYEFLVHTIRSNDTCKIDDIKSFVQSYYDIEIRFIEEEKDDFNGNIDFCESFIQYMIDNMILPNGLEFSVGSTDWGDYGILCMFDDSNIDDILNFEKDIEEDQYEKANNALEVELGKNIEE